MNKCIHRWRLSEPNGPLADAVCRNCGEVRKMLNADPLDTTGRPLGLAMTPGSIKARESGWQRKKKKTKEIALKEKERGRPHD